MARRVFFSFHYDNDINRSMTVGNSWVTQGKEAAGFIDKAEFEQIKLKGDQAFINRRHRKVSCGALSRRNRGNRASSVAR